MSNDLGCTKLDWGPECMAALFRRQACLASAIVNLMRLQLGVPFTHMPIVGEQRTHVKCSIRCIYTVWSVGVP
jgi:hypothetical protein